MDRDFHNHYYVVPMYGEGEYGIGPYGYADPAMVRLALGQLERSNTPVDRKLHVYLEVVDLQAQGAQFSTQPPTPLSALGDVLSEINQQAKGAGILQKGSRTASSFFINLAA